MLYQICFHWGLQATQKGASSLNLKTLLSNHVFQSYLSRKASTFAPVLYPFPELVQDATDLVGLPDFNFQIQNVRPFTQSAINSGMITYMCIPVCLL